MAKTMKLFYESPRGKRERLRNRRTTLFRKAYELESKCDAEILVLIATQNKKYLYKSQKLDKVLDGTSVLSFVCLFFSQDSKQAQGLIEAKIEESWPPPQLTSASDFNKHQTMNLETESHDSPCLMYDSSDFEKEQKRSSPSAATWNIKVVPTPPDIVISPIISRSEDGYKSK